MKLDMYETRKESELFCFPSTSIVFGTSEIRFSAALKQASAEISSLIIISIIEITKSSL
jgi:hypothetical protein